MCQMTLRGSSRAAGRRWRSSFRGVASLLSLSHAFLTILLCFLARKHMLQKPLQLSATDISAQATMKGAAKCDKHCELQISVSQQKPERILRFRDIPESMPASVSTSFCQRSARLVASESLGVVCVRLGRPLLPRRCVRAFRT